MKEYQNLIGKLAIAAAIILAGAMVSHAIETAGGNMGSQIASALAVFLQ